MTNLIIKGPFIETFIGTIIFGVYFSLDYMFAMWFQDLTKAYGMETPWPAGMMFGIVFSACIFFIVMLSRVLGIAICDGLNKLGYDPRPTKRNM